ncbi:glycosyltransferase 1 domain-containing protein 1 isoform X1 [Tachysurus vachellii]|uniref:glycosyltransferase 1 domain-containing protein 1 isoform X1 n=1 Tax=Tachysurus vachellii TaxID=175792 RepID=UPI00296B4597|nr:glycosyltransferase 1 domain-containing protein 1 isoform X1 [Tachysurus vachellii]
MRLLFLACLIPKTGNCTTAERMRDHIESAGHVCVLRDTTDFSSASDVKLLMSQDKEPFDAAMAIHLFKGARFLLDAGLPFGVVFGGTDINEDVKDDHKRSVMEEVLHRARFAVAFTEEMKQKAKVYLDCDITKIYVQAHGIETRASPTFSWTDFLHTTGVRVDRVDDLRVFLLVCGLRKVKDPLYLLNTFSGSYSPVFPDPFIHTLRIPDLQASSFPGRNGYIPREWHAQNPLVILIIIGPKIDPVFSSEVEECVKRSAGVFLAAERNQEELHAVMRKSFAVVNSSVSEGMSAAILEAMDLCVPVLARDIPGNAAVVQHGHSGLLFSSPEEFVLLSKRLLGDEELQENLRTNGKRYVMETHDCVKERRTYQQLVEKLQ